MATIWAIVSTALSVSYHLKHKCHACEPSNGVNKIRKTYKKHTCGSNRRWWSRLVGKGIINFMSLGYLWMNSKLDTLIVQCYAPGQPIKQTEKAGAKEKNETIRKGSGNPEEKPKIHVRSDVVGMDGKQCCCASPRHDLFNRNSCIDSTVNSWSGTFIFTNEIGINSSAKQNEPGNFRGLHVDLKISQRIGRNTLPGNIAALA